MTVAQLIAVLKAMPQDYTVVIETGRLGYVPVDGATETNVDFFADGDWKMNQPVVLLEG